MHSLDIHLDEETVVLVKPEDCGYEYDQDDLIPTTSWKTLEPHWSVSCTCMKCARSTCPCRMAGVKCGLCCHCKKKSPTACKNPITWLYYYVLRGGHLTYSNLIVCYYGRPLSVSRRPCYILPMFFLINFFYGRLILRPWWTEVRESFTRAGPWVSLKKLLLGFFPGHP